VDFTTSLGAAVPQRGPGQAGDARSRTGEGVTDTAVLEADGETGVDRGAVQDTVGCPLQRRARLVNVAPPRATELAQLRDARPQGAVPEAETRRQAGK
jgi:hypothetical protein